MSTKMVTRLLVIRRKAGLSQEDLATLTGLTQPQISRIERGDRSCGEDVLQSLAEALSFAGDPRALLDELSEDRRYYA